MLVRVLRPTISLTVIGALLLAALAAFVILGAEKTHADSTFTPALAVKYCNSLDPTFAADTSLQGNTSCTENLASSAAADFWTELDVNNTLDLNFSNITTFAPEASTFTAGTSIATGALIGAVSSLTTLGVLNAFCNPGGSQVFEFVLYNVALPDNPGDPRASTNIAWPRDEGSSDRYKTWSTGTGDHFADAGTGQFVPDPFSSLSTTLTDIAFVDGGGGTDDITSIAGDLGGFSEGGNITVSGSTSNDGSYTIISITSDGAGGVTDEIEVATASLTTEGIGASVTITDSVEVIGTPLYANGDAVAIQNYPIYLLDAFDPDFTPGNFDPLLGDVTGDDGTDKPILPIAAYGGNTQIAGSWISLYFLQFAKGALTDLGGNAAGWNDSQGQPSVTVLQDPVAVGASPSTITDFCTPLLTETLLLGTSRDCTDCSPTISSSTVRVTNPPDAGTYFVTSYAASLRDLDQDGYENSVDNCQFDPSNDPRVPSDTAGNGPGGGDTDSAVGDGIDQICDTVNPNSALLDILDDDGDLFQNRQDNCATLANPLNRDSEVNVPISAAEDDGGPKGDTIGDLCDTGTVTVEINGTAAEHSPLLPHDGNPGTDGFNGSGSYEIILSDSVANGRYHIVHNIIPKCFGGLADNDGDGYCANPNGDTFGKDIAADPASLVMHNKWIGAHPALQGDSDGDGFSDVAETYLRTDPVFACSANSGNTNEPTNHWPLDLTDNRIVNTLDVAKFVVPLNLYIGHVDNVVAGVTVDGQELDFNFDGIINTLDVAKYVPFLNDKCSAAFGSPNAGFEAFADTLQ